MKLKIVDAMLKDNNYNPILIPIIKLILTSSFSSAEIEIEKISEDDPEYKDRLTPKEFKKAVSYYKENGLTADEAFQKLDEYFMKYNLNIPFLRKITIDKWEDLDQS